MTNILAEYYKSGRYVIESFLFLHLQSKPESRLMSEKSVSLHTLPLEILYKIFDNLQFDKLFFLIQNTCQRLHDTVNSYHRFRVK